MFESAYCSMCHNKVCIFSNLGSDRARNAANSEVFEFRRGAVDVFIFVCFAFDFPEWIITIVI